MCIGDAAVVWKLDHSPAVPEISAIGWDTEGGDRAKLNLLRAPASVNLLIGGQLKPGKDFPTEVTEKGRTTLCTLTPGPGSRVVYEIVRGKEKVEFRFRFENPEAAELEAIELAFPFDPVACATTVIPSKWEDPDGFRLPAVLSAPDCGQLMLTGKSVMGSLTGDRYAHRIDLSLRIPARDTTVVMRPVRLPMPGGFKDE